MATVSDSGVVPKSRLIVPVPVNVSVPSDTVNTVNENVRLTSTGVEPLTSTSPETVTDPEIVTPSLHQLLKLNVALIAPVTSSAVPLYDAVPPQLPGGNVSETDTDAPTIAGEDAGDPRCAALTASVSTREIATAGTGLSPPPD
jgi:hypothetical protein